MVETADEPVGSDGEAFPGDGGIAPTEFLSDERAALLLSLIAAAEGGWRGEVPVGAVLRDARGRFLAQEANRRLQGFDPTGHAEMRALVTGAGRLGNDRLGGCTLAVSLEPCPMCLQALALARVSRVRFAAARGPETEKKPQLEPGADAGQTAFAAGLLRFFFEQRRKI